MDEKTDFDRDFAVCDGILRLCTGGTGDDAASARRISP